MPLFGPDTHRLRAHGLGGLKGGLHVACRAALLDAGLDAVDEGGARAETLLVARAAAACVCGCNAVLCAGWRGIRMARGKGDYGRRTREALALPDVCGCGGEGSGEREEGKGEAHGEGVKLKRQVSCGAAQE